MPRIWPLAHPDLRELKTRRTLDTEADLAALRRREPGTRAAAGYPRSGWRAVARRWLRMSDEEVFNVFPGSCVPRVSQMVLRSAHAEDSRGKGFPVPGRVRPCHPLRWRRRRQRALWLRYGRVIEHARFTAAAATASPST